jgi:hypothetical protein
MPRPRTTAVRVALISVVVITASGCGGEEEPSLLAPDDAGVLLELLDDAERRFDQGSCDELESTLNELDRETDGLPDAEVDPQLRTTLNAEIVELNELADRCRPDEEEIVPAPVAPAPTVVPETTAPVPVPEETTTIEEPETETKEEPPPSQEQPERPANPPEPPEPEEPPGRDPCQNGSPRC